MASPVIVIPCYNEEKRFPTATFDTFLKDAPALRFLFVNDGSKDNTQAVLEALAGRWPRHCLVHGLQINGGKAEAVRQGCLRAFELGADQVGYWDADLATPLEAISEFLEVLGSRPELELVCGARVQLLGRSVVRSRMRHYGGRVFATLASLALGLNIYDTQCGAKIFRVTPRVRFAFQQPFQTRWLIDVEIMARMAAVTRTSALRPLSEVIYELPLQQWHDLAGSKVKPLDFPKAILELGRIYWRYLRRHAPALTLPVETETIRHAAKAA